MSKPTLQQACRSIEVARWRRDQLVLKLHKDGMSLRDIAEASHGALSHAGVATIIKRLTQQEEP